MKFLLALYYVANTWAFLPLVIALTGTDVGPAIAFAQERPAQEVEAEIAAPLARVVELEKRLLALERRLTTTEQRTAPTPKEAKKAARERFKAFCNDRGLDFDGLDINTKGEQVVRCR